MKATTQILMIHALRESRDLDEIMTHIEEDIDGMIETVHARAFLSWVSEDWQHRSVGARNIQTRVNEWHLDICAICDACGEFVLPNPAKTCPYCGDFYDYEDAPTAQLMAAAA